MSEANPQSGAAAVEEYVPSSVEDVLGPWPTLTDGRCKAELLRYHGERSLAVGNRLNIWDENGIPPVGFEGLGAPP